MSPVAQDLMNACHSTARRPTGWAVLAVGLALAGAASPAPATVLIFEPTDRNFQRTDQAYGDRVVATAQDGFLYGADGGFTPNVMVAYGRLPGAFPSQWTFGYGDLQGILFDDEDSFGHLEIELAADAGWWVTLAHFDMAAYRPVAPINDVRVVNGAGDELFRQDGVAVPDVGHISFDFDPPLQGRWLTISFDASNLGGWSDDIGIDNVTFSQMELPTGVDAGSWTRTKALYR